MPFRLRDAANTFQRMIDGIFRNFECTFVYIDDILIYSDDEDSHSKHVDQVFRKLSEYDLNISISKGIFAATEAGFLEFNILKEGIKPKLQELTSFPPPNSDSKKLRWFLGIVNF